MVIAEWTSEKGRENISERNRHQLQQERNAPVDSLSTGHLINFFKNFP
jgi:hypothetical protein